MLTANDLRDGSSIEFANWMYRLMRIMEESGYNDRALATIDLVAYHDYYIDGLSPEGAFHESENP